MCNREKTMGRNVNLGLTEPFLIIQYIVIKKSPSQKNHSYVGAELALTAIRGS